MPALHHLEFHIHPSRTHPEITTTIQSPSRIAVRHPSVRHTVHALCTRAPTKGWTTAGPKKLFLGLLVLIVGKGDMGRLCKGHVEALFIACLVSGLSRPCQVVACLGLVKGL